LQARRIDSSRAVSKDRIWNLSFSLVCATLAVQVLAGAGCHPGDPPPVDPDTLRRPGANLILISIDTLRADRLGVYGYERGTSPNLDALARRSVVFRNAIAEASWTLPSHATLFSGTLPSTHGAVRFLRRIPPKLTTLTEVLAERGYRNFGLVAGGFVGRAYGFARGFEEYDESSKRTFDETIDAALDRIRSLSRDESFFLFLHTFQVHCPYRVDSQAYQRFAARPDDPGRFDPFCQDAIFHPERYTPEQVQVLSDRYDAAIWRVDEALGGFLRELEQMGKLQDSVLVVTSDHGEEFSEHGALGHGVSLYAEVIRVPLILTAPGIEPREIHRGIGLVDLMPTLLDLLAIEAPASVEGRSRLDAIAGVAEATQEPLFSEIELTRKLRSVVLGERHVIHDLETGRYQSFDWSSDAGELDGREVFDGEAVDLLNALGPAPERKDFEMTPELRRELEALGYLESGSPDPTE